MTNFTLASWLREFKFLPGLTHSLAIPSVKQRNHKFASEATIFHSTTWFWFRRKFKFQWFVICHKFKTFPNHIHMKTITCPYLSENFFFCLRRFTLNVRQWPTCIMDNFLLPLLHPNQYCRIPYSTCISNHLCFAFPSKYLSVLGTFYPV